MSIAKRADGRFVVKYKSGDTWKQRSFRNAEEAVAFDAEQNAPKLDANLRLTLGELTIKYFQSNPDKHPRTKKMIVYFLAGYDEGKQHIDGAGEFLRDKYAESLNRADLEHMRDIMRGKGAGPNTINKYQAYIRAILAWGVDQDLIKFNPWRDYKRLKTKKHVVIVSVDQLKKLYPELPPYLQWATKTAFFLALRPGLVELFSLTWDAFDWRRGLVRVRQGKSGYIKTVVPHPAYMSEARERFVVDMAAGIPLVCHRNGRKVLSYKEAWNAACRRAGVVLRPYDIRHIAATEMLAQGADLAAVAAQLGHSNVATTGGTYAHVTQGSQARAAALMPSIEDEK